MFLLGRIALRSINAASCYQCFMLCLSVCLCLPVPPPVCLRDTSATPTKTIDVNNVLRFFYFGHVFTLFNVLFLFSKRFFNFFKKRWQSSYHE